MGSCLGPTFANFYMAYVENNVLKNEEVKPSVYCRYVDDIFVIVRNEQHLQELKQHMESSSVLKFTYELSVQGKIPFLDVAITQCDNKIITDVYRKPTDMGKCINAASECPQRYKTSVIRSYIRRAYKICSSWQLFDAEIRRVKQNLVNNGFSNNLIESEIKIFLDKTHNKKNKLLDQTYNVYYCNQMSESYKTDERILKEMIKSNVKCNDNSYRLNLIIYYKNAKTKNLVMQNNIAAKRSGLQRTNVLYEFTCPKEDCRLLQNMKYIGETTTSLSRRLTMHLQNGAIRKHFNEKHQEPLARSILESNTKIQTEIRDHNRLAITEAIVIKERNPLINIQDTGICRTLKY